MHKLSSQVKSVEQKKGLQLTFIIVIFLVIVIILSVIGYKIYNNHSNSGLVSNHISAQVSTKYDYLPSSTGEVVYHKYYTLSYVEKHEQPEWVAYVLTRASLNKPNVKREKDFEPDPAVSTYSATSNDYRGSGYTRGHLAPAGDMAFDAEAMKESFYMSNMSPQLRQLNNGIWRELEENVRDWTYKADSLYVISGPVFANPIKIIGKSNMVTVPSAFYKVLLDNNGPEKKAIGFIIPHELSEKRLETYMVTVQDVEKITDLKFFENMPGQQEVTGLKSSINPSKWKVSDKRYQLRVTKWNYE